MWDLIGLLSAGITVMVATPARAEAEAAQPLTFFDQSPLALIYGLPTPRGPQVLAENAQELNFSLDYTSQFFSRSRGNESLILDGETTRVAITYRRGLGHGFEANIEVPFIDHSGGFADGFFDGFHDVTGFADGGRDHAPRKRQLYRYIRNGQMLLDVRDSPSGIGDIRFGIAKDLALIDTVQTSVNAQLKLPTGEEDELTGSGSTDLALWLSAARGNFLFDGFSIVGAAGGLYTGEGEVLAAQREQGAGFGWLGLGYAWSEHLVLKVQLYAHSQLYNQSQLKALEGVAVQGGAGFTWLFSQITQMDFSIIEDLNAEASPDVGFNLSVRRGF